MTVKRLGEKSELSTTMKRCTGSPVLPLNMVDNSTHPFQTNFGPVYGHEAVPTGHFTLE